MLIIAENTERQLLQELKHCRDNFPTFRCLHLKFSQIDLEKQNWFSVFAKFLESYFEDQKLRIYRCYDSDVFVLTRTMTQKRVDEFLAHLPPQLGPALQLFSKPGLASLFEIGVDWPRLRTLCEKKIENIKIEHLHQEAEARKRAERAKIHREETLKTIDVDLIKSLSARRKHRDLPEIMVVEDDLFSQKLVGNALKGQYPLSMTGDGQGALMNYVSKAPDVLFLDIGLPDINGHEVLEKLFKIDPDAYVVMFSGNGDKDNVLKAIQLGAKGFVGKPFTKEKLFQYIQKSPFIQEKQNREKAHGHSIR